MGQNIFFQYIEWQFVDSAKGILKAWKNCLSFNLNYWSVVLLLKTFFSHWRRYGYSYGKDFDFKRYFEVFTFNIISRVIGAILRSFLIVFGLLTEIFIIIAGLSIFLFWIFLPFLIIFGIFYGFKLSF
ncbi:MAG: hypothetical protein HYT20_03120 [Candidatus Nealsonbacteria bacterium]|nr:hypothetical protein [Candidatus Nealsonbacteria bacterium]